MSDDNKHAVMLEINSETDFVARDENFLAFANAAAKTALEHGTQDVQQLAGLSLAGQTGVTIDEARQNLIAKVGENVNIRRIVVSRPTAENIGTYLHGNRIGVL